VTSEIIKGWDGEIGGGLMNRAAVDRRVAELIAEYGSPDACPGALLCDRHRDEAVAFTVVEPDLSYRDLTFGELGELSAQFAAGLAGLGVGPGDAVATLMGKSAELVVALLGIWRRGAVHVPLFTAFAPAAIAFRLARSGAKVVVADEDQRAKLEPGGDIPADPPWRIVSGGQSRPGDVPLAEMMANGGTGPLAPPEAVGAAAPLVPIFTSGTTGAPKGVPVPVRALAGICCYMDYGLDVQPDDAYWNAADPGWAYGLYYAILGPLATGMRSILLHAGFSAPLTCQVLQRFGVTNFAAAPTIYRALRASDDQPAGYQLRRASSGGEPLTPDIVAWSKARLGTEVRDHYGQTEHGMLIVNGWHDDVRSEVRPGSMGQPLPGFSCAVLHNDRDEPATAGTPGRIAVDMTASPLTHFTGYHGDTGTTGRFTPGGRWWLTGDAGYADADGHYFFSARDDDVIIMAGYRIGPFDVESVLVTHDQVIETAVIGVPDQLRGEVIEAFVVLRDPSEGTDELVGELQQLVKDKFAAHAYPRRVHFVEALPKTPSGKVQRYLLRRQRAGSATS
jgi:acetyl-CoA synthetase